ncbi:hypothetical protein SDRG_13415 [Saprolegnia diclina VS20]|uniref:Uncharacterized protein n=1 Tax=Saprolegnia diclina (strain VS20) TaxID=1156394 RepID=T0Q638_SAPDV|nr:hypothetical protein SDRG_13415 [Saprolegnia diclina VS20]EQC28905.1 hypothetical protein SDRG_13415 [Saprolegnia diclina VS20]|eukprot:XP_008617722.1 hypothetical protein SDRG_13415 [Saprolegnia diclina VS20]
MEGISGIDHRYGQGADPKLQPYVALLKTLLTTTRATIELLFASQCLLFSILAVQGPPSDAITCASVAASTLDTH